MLKLVAAAGLGALMVLSPFAAAAQTAAPATDQQSAHKPTGSFRSEMRNRHNSSKERARAGAEHVRKMRSQ